MRVIATKVCFVGGARRRVGDTFDYDGPVDADGEPKASYLRLAKPKAEAPKAKTEAEAPKPAVPPGKPGAKPNPGNPAAGLT